MLAAVFQGPGRISLEQVDDPPVGSHDVLLEVGANTVCGTDVKIFHGDKPVEAPAVLGHEIAGRVAVFGEEVRGYEEGQLVGVAPVIGCGRCHCCGREQTNICPEQSILGYDITGGLGQYVRVPGRAVRSGHVVTAKSDIPPESLALAEPLSCCINGQTLARVGADDAMLVLGGGPIGLFHLQLALLAGARTVIVSDPLPARRQWAVEFGADVAVDPEAEDLTAAVEDATDGLGVDVALVCAPLPELVDEAIGLVRRGGRVNIFAGMPSPGEATINANVLHYNELEVTGTSNSTARHYRAAVELIEAGRIAADRMVTHCLPLARVSEALELVDSRKAMKVAVLPGLDDQGG